jgi:transcription initiation factor IIE alpha subunit
MAVLPGRAEKGRSMKEIAQAMGIEVCNRTDWIRTERSLARVLRRLSRWGIVACNRRQNTDGNRFWYNVYWKVRVTAPEQAAQEKV